MSRSWRGASATPTRPPAPVPPARYSTNDEGSVSVVEYTILVVLIAAVIVVTTLVMWHQTRPTCDAVADTARAAAVAPVEDC